MSISAELLQKLACPCAQHGELKIVDSRIVSSCCGANFEIRAGIPVLLPKGE